MKNKLLLLLVLFLSIPIGGAWAQNITVKGVVIDQTGETVIGASVVEQGNTTNGTITNIDGEFTLSIPRGKKVVISYIGMVTQEVEVTPGKDLQVVLNDDSQALEEVVVIGYGGSKARKDLTGSVGSVSGMKLAQVPVASAAEALQGKIAGVQVTTVDGAPGADVNIRIRGGGTSLTGDASTPLYVVDGFIADNINDIPPTDIQSIDVLKDASLTAIYGARGGNGVVIVTTKSAQAGKVSVEVNTSWQWKKLAGKLDLLNTYEFVLYQLDYTYSSNSRVYQFRNDFGNPNDLDIYKTAVTHDWQDEVMGGTALTQNYNISVKGGNDKIRFSTSLTHNDESGLVPQSGVRRTNMNTKFEIQITPKVKLLINPRFTYRRDLGAGADAIGSGGIIDVLRYRPTNGLREYMFRDSAWESYSEEKYWLLSSPLEDIEQNYYLKHTFTFQNQASLTWNIIKGLTFRTDFSQSWSIYDQNRFYGALTTTGIENDDMPVAQITNRRTDKYTWTNTLSYDFTYKEDHNFSFLIGHEVSHKQYVQDYSAARYFPEEIDARTAFANMGLGTPYEVSSYTSTPERTLSVFAQANYNFKHKYLLSATFRADASTIFAPGHQWGYFPSVSGAWVISEEEFMEGTKDWLSNWKIRAAFGLAGNNDIGLDRWRYYYSITSNGGPSWGESTTDGEAYYSVGNILANEKIKWETTVTRNVAMDFSFFDGRLSFTPEFYWNTTKDMLYKSYIPRATGYTYQYKNIGQLTNKGIEITLSGDIIRKKDAVLTATLTMGFNKTKIDKINGEDSEIWTTSSRWSSSDDDFCLKEGEEVGLIYGYVYDGIYGFDGFSRVSYSYEPDEGTLDCDALYGTMPGRPKFVDQNGDGVIDSNDRVKIGNTNPRLQGGISLSGQWKDFDFTANFTYMLNFDLLNATKFTLSSSYGSSQTAPKNVLKDFDYDHRWVYHGDIYYQYSDGTTYLYNANEKLLANSQHIEYLDTYEELNSGKSLWNPNDVSSKYTFSYFVEDGSFLRLQDLTIGYTLPSKITRKWGIQRLRVYVTGTNLFCLTSYSGFDPEIDIQSGVTPSVDYNRYPRSHGYLVGLNLSF